MIRAVLVAAAFAGFVLAGGAAAACPPSAVDGTRVDGEQSSLAFNVFPQPIAVGRSFSIEVLACRQDGGVFDGTLSVDAGMPAHGHGMNYRPTVTRLGDGRFRAQGFLFHMPGHWRVTFNLLDAGVSERLQADLRVR